MIQIILGEKIRPHTVLCPQDILRGVQITLIKLEEIVVCLLAIYHEEKIIEVTRRTIGQTIDLKRSSTIRTFTNPHPPLGMVVIKYFASHTLQI